MAGKTRAARGSSWALLALLLCCAGHAHAQSDPDAIGADDDRGLEVGLTVGATHSDNIERVPSDEQSGALGLAGVQLSYREKTRRMEADVDVDAGYAHYFDDNFDDDIIGGADAQFTFGIAPDVFEWFVHENFGQVAVDPFAVITPDNRENISYFTTGPDFTLHFGSETWLTLAGRYSDTNYETSNFDGTETGGTLTFAHQMSAVGRLSLNFEAAAFEFDDEVSNTNYDRYDAYLRYQIEGARTTMTADAGYASLDFDGEKSDGVVARLSVTRHVSRSSTLDLSLGSQFSNAGDLFRGNQNLEGVDTDALRVNGSGDPFENQFAALRYEFARNRTSLGLGVQYSEEDYEQRNELDRTWWSWNVYLDRDMSSRMSGRIYLQLDRQEFDVTDFDDETLRAGGYLDWQLGRQLSMRLQYEHNDRDSSDADTEFSENLLSLFMIWSPVQRP